MAMTHIHDDEAALLDYLYEEGDPDERLKIARHLQSCASCSVAALELQEVRGLLGEWAPPAAAPGFRLAVEGRQHDAPIGSSPRAWRRWSNWTQAAAGIFLFAAGMGFSQLHFEYASGALTVRVGAPPAADASEPPVHAGRNVTLPAEPVAIAARAPAEPPAAAASADAVLQRVRTLITQSESRQQHELALRLSQMVSDFEAQRRADLLRVDQNFLQLEGQTGAEVAQQRALLNSLVKVSQGGAK